MGIKMKKFENLTGKIFGQLKVLKKDNKRYILPSGIKYLKWICECNCEEVISVIGNYLRSGQTTRCKKCHYKSKQLNGYISALKIRRIEYGAKVRNIYVDKSIINKKYLWKLYLKQNKQCVLSGIDIKFAKSGKDESYHKGTTASLDRIDSKKGYIRNNIQWVHKDINKMKHTYSSQKFINLCKEITLNNKNKIIHTTSKSNEEINKHKIISLAYIKKEAKRRNIYFHPELTHSFLHKLYLDQNKKCALTGRDIYFTKNRKEIQNNKASLDRIDSSKGYTKDNLQWIYKDVNMMKWELKQEYFIKLCEKVAGHNKN